MVLRYSVVRYVPSVVRDEAVNVGVLLETDNPPGLYLRFLSAMSRVRRKYPETNVLALRHLSDHFQRLRHEIDPHQPVFDFAAAPGVTLETLHRGSIDTTFQLTSPRATMGDDPAAELTELFDLFVAEQPSAESPARTTFAPARFRRLVTTRLRRSGLLEGNRLQPRFQVDGTVQPWIFDFGHRNTSLTLVQSLALRTNPDEAMDRALLLEARVADVSEAEQIRPVTIAVTDEVGRDSPALRYLDHHNVKIVPADNTDELKAVLEPELEIR
jgi:hypothetical protein